MKRNCMIRLLLLMMAVLLTGCASAAKIAENQRVASAHRGLGEAYMGQQEYSRALREFMSAEELYPKDHLLQEDLGLAYLAKGATDKAIEHLKKSLKIKPDYSPARNNLGIAYIEKQDWKNAIDCFLKVKDDLTYLTPQYPLTNLGFVYYKMGDYQKAIKYLKEAIELKPDFPKAHHNLGLVYMATGDYAKAVSSIKRAVELAPDEAPLYLDLGKAYKLDQEYNKAYQAFKKAASLAKDNTSLKKEADKEAQDIWDMK